MQVSHEEILVDPKNPEFAMLMEALINFSLKKGDVLLEINKPYQINMPDKPNPITIKLTNDILLRVKEKLGSHGEHQLEPHCYVLGSIGKKGSLQNVGVPDILGVLQFDKTQQKKGLIYTADESKNKSRSVNIKKHKFSSHFLEKNEIKNLGELKALIERRLSILQAYIPFHAKNIIGKEFDQIGEIESYTKMKKFKGELLSVILKNENRDLSTQFRLQLSIALLEELKVLHNLGITHGDIKPENIIVNVDKETGKIQVRFINFESAISKNFQGEGRLTPAYASPEHIIDDRHRAEIEANKRKLSVDKQSDIWQMGLVLGEVWQGKQRDSNWHMHFDDKTLLTDKAEPNLFDELDIFRDIKNINVNDAKFNDETKSLYQKFGIQSEVVDFDLIANTIKSMMLIDKNKRIEIDKALDNFENVRFNYLYPLSSANLLDAENSLQALISALRGVNHYAKIFRHSNLFHISLMPKDIVDLQINGFAYVFNYINLLIKDDNDKATLVRELKDVLDLNTFNTCINLEEMHETSKNILQQSLDLKYQHLNLLFKVKMTLQLLEMMADPAKNQIIKLPFKTDKKSELINPLITMNTLLTKINDLYRERAYNHLNNLDDIKEFNDEFDRKLNALEHSFNDLNNRCLSLLQAKGAKDSKEQANSNIILASDTGFNYFKRYEIVLSKLNIVNPERPLDELKNNIKIAIIEYLDEITKTKLVPPNGLADLEAIGKIMSNESIIDSKVLIDTLQNYLNKMERRFIVAPPLQTKIEEAMNKFTHGPKSPRDVAIKKSV